MNFFIYNLILNGDSTVKWCGNSLHKYKWFSLATDILEYFMCFDWSILIWEYWNHSFKYYCFQAHKYLREKNLLSQKNEKHFTELEVHNNFIFNKYESKYLSSTTFYPHQMDPWGMVLKLWGVFILTSSQSSNKLKLI